MASNLNQTFCIWYFVFRILYFSISTIAIAQGKLMLGAWCLWLFSGHNAVATIGTNNIAQKLHVEAVFFNASQLAISDYEDQLLLYTLQVRRVIFVLRQLY